MALREIVSSYWSCFQALLFPQLEETIGALGQRHQRLVMVLEWVRVETLLPYPRSGVVAVHTATAKPWLAPSKAKAVFDLATTRMLLDRLRHDTTAPCVTIYLVRHKTLGSPSFLDCNRPDTYRTVALNWPHSASHAGRLETKSCVRH